MNQSNGGEEPFWRRPRWWQRAGQASIALWGSNLLSFVGTVIAARALGPDDYGTVVLAIGVAMLASTFLDLTLEEAVVFHGSRALAKNDLGGLRALLVRSMRLDIAIGIIVTAIIIALAGPIAEVSSGGRLDPNFVRIAALSVLLLTADTTFSAVLLLSGGAHFRAWAMTATSIFRFIGIAIAVLIGEPEAFLAAHVAGGAAGSVVLGALAWRVGWRKWAFASGAGPTTPPVSEWTLVRFAMHSSLTTTVYAAYGSLVPVLLGATAGPTAVGVFRVALFPVIAANSLTAPVRLMMFPEQSRLVAEGRVDELLRSVKGYTLIGFAVGGVGALLAWLAMPWLIPLLYSSQFEAAVEPARILLVAALFYFALSWGKTIPAAVGRPQIRTVIATIELVVMASLLLVLGDRGSEGGAIAVSAGSVAVGIAWLVVASNLRRFADR